MSNDSTYVKGDFKFASHKRKQSKYAASTIKPTTVNEDINIELTISRINKAKSEILCTDLFDSVTAAVREGCSQHENFTTITEIVCFGLGRIGECLISRYQFALLLCLRDLYEGITIKLFDPIFTSKEIDILKYFNCEILTENLEGKYRGTTNGYVLFYLPHCPKQLTNNLLWVNWGIGLSKCVIISNSFNSILENCSKRILQSSAEFILKISPYVVEFAIVNSFKYFEVFNDTSVHVFPNLHLISGDLWEAKLEPQYSNDDLEFIRKC